MFDTMNMDHESLKFVFPRGAHILGIGSDSKTDLNDLETRNISFHLQVCLQATAPQCFAKSEVAQQWPLRTDP